MKHLKMVFTALFFVSLLAACGGGGGGEAATTPTTPALPLPTARVVSFSPAIGETNVATAVAPIITLSVTDATGSDASKLSFICSGRSVIFTPTPKASTLSADKKTTTMTLTPQSKAVLVGDSCTIDGKVTTEGPGGSVDTPISMSFTIVPIPGCTAPTSWSATGTICGAPVATQVIGAGQLPATCSADLQKCLDDGKLNGTIKEVGTSYTINGRVVDALYFQNSTAVFGTTGQWVVLFVYHDDQSLVGNLIDILGGTSQTIAWVIGASNGVIAYIKETSKCALYSWDSTSKSTVSEPTTCPTIP